MDSIWSRFLGQFGQRKSVFLTLPEEVIVDNILSLLSIPDILRIRRVCKAFKLLTKKPAIWKRFLPLLQDIQQPLAPLPPTSQYDFRNISAIDIENIITRAVSYDDNWMSRSVRARASSFSSFHNVLEMVLLPGGHLMVMSVKSFDGQHGIILWAIEHPATGKPAPLVFRSTGVKAYALQAKYMTVREKNGVCIAFLRKRHKKPDDPRHIPETQEMGGKEDEEDPFMPIKYECTTIHISFYAIERLTDRRVFPGTREFDTLTLSVKLDEQGNETIRKVSSIRTGTQLGVVTLDVIDDQPHVCVVKRPNVICMENLNNKQRTFLEPKDHLDYGRRRHSIWNFRVLPAQRQVLVFRAIPVKRRALQLENQQLLQRAQYAGPSAWGLAPGPLEIIYDYVMEFFPLPAAGKKSRPESTTSYSFIGERYLNVKISEVNPNISRAEDPSITPFLLNNRPPPPISIYCRTRKGVAQWTTWPIAVQLPPTPPRTPSPSPVDIVESSSKSPNVRYFYDARSCLQTYAGFKPGTLKGELRAVPGTYRAIMYEVPSDFRSLDPPVSSIWAFMYKGDARTRYLQDARVLGPDVMSPDFVPTPEALGLADELAEEEQVLDYLRDDDQVPVQNAKGLTPDERVAFPRKHGKRRKPLEPILIPTAIAEQIKKGVTAICWDEDTGRVVVATGDARLNILDFAHSRRADEVDREMNTVMDFAITLDNERMTDK